MTCTEVDQMVRRVKLKVVHMMDDIINGPSGDGFEQSYQGKL